MSKVIIATAENFMAMRGVNLGPTAWREVKQSDVNTFADAVGDHQWIHVDVDRAKRDSPFGGTVAHGNLTLSLIDTFMFELMDFSGAHLVVNYGWNKVRFPAPVRVGTRIRARCTCVSVEDVGNGWFQVVQAWVVERESETKPACAAEHVIRALFK